MLNKKNKIFILVADNINQDGFKHLSPKKFSIIIKTGLSNGDILNNYNYCDVLVIRSTRKIDKNFIEKCNFKIIASCTKGLDHVDLHAAEKYGVKILNSESGNVVSAAEHTFALILEIAKQISFSDSLVRTNKFKNYNFKRMELRGKKIGIIGFGKVGSRVARYAKSFEMEILPNDINPEVAINNPEYKFRSLNYVLKNSDIVTVHIPLNKKNKNFINKTKLKLLKNNSIFINTSRGEVIDEMHLIGILKNNLIHFAGLDVFVNEPDLNKSLFLLKNAVFSNHIAGKTEDSLKYISNDIFMQVKKCFSW